MVGCWSGIHAAGYGQTEAMSVDGGLHAALKKVNVVGR